DAQGYQHATATALPGQRVFFRQRREGADDEFIEAEAQTLRYDGRADAVALAGRGQLRHYRGTLLAGGPVGGHTDNRDAVGGAVPGPEAGAQRVRVMLVQRPAQPPASEAGPGQGLKGADSLAP